jgi:hypothetical protein
MPKGAAAAANRRSLLKFALATGIDSYFTGNVYPFTEKEIIEPGFKIMPGKSNQLRVE